MQHMQPTLICKHNAGDYGTIPGQSDKYKKINFISRGYSLPFSAIAVICNGHSQDVDPTLKQCLAILVQACKNVGYTSIVTS